MMKEWEKFMEEADKRDHRKIGVVLYALIAGTRAFYYSRALTWIMVLSTPWNQNLQHID